MPDIHSRCPLVGGSTEIEIKKSRFIACVIPVETVNDALAFIEQTKKTHWDATHNCYAFIIGEDMLTQRFSDDGEPQGTAGRPMLEVLINSGLHNVAAVVTRYFGGTLLGTGGLVRAYGQSVSEALKKTVIIEKLTGTDVLLEMDYPTYGKAEYYFETHHIPIQSVNYGESVKIEVFLTSEELIQIEEDLNELSNGKISINNIRQVKFGRSEDKAIILG